MNGNSNTVSHSSPVRKGSSFRQIIHAALSWLMMALAVIFGVVGTVAAFFGAAFLVDSSSALFVVAFGVGFLITFGGAWIAARMMIEQDRSESPSVLVERRCSYWPWSRP